MLPPRSIHIWDFSFSKPVDFILHEWLLIFKKFIQYKAQVSQQFELAEEGVEVLFKKIIAL